MSTGMIVWRNGLERWPAGGRDQGVVAVTGRA